MKYNVSKYNIVVEEDENYVFLYNSFTGAFVKLEQAVYKSIVDEVIDDTSPCLYFKELKEQGFLKPVELNEYNKIITNAKQAMYEKNTDSLSLVIAPTMACNLHCKYCFEDGYRKNERMSEETVDALIDYICKRIEQEKIKHIHVSWFGGEPLLAYSTIVDFSKKLYQKIGGKYIDYTSSMITNGVLLSCEKARYLAQNCGLKKVQITIDGTKSIYCEQKGATVEQYQQVLNNIKNAVRYIKVAIRFNCDKGNYSDIMSAAKKMALLCDDYKNLSFYLAKIADYGCECGNKLFLQEEFDQKVIEFERFSCELLKREYKPTLPKYRRLFCGLFKLRNLVVGPTGLLYKCEHHLGRNDKVIGNIWQGLFYTDEMLEFINNIVDDKCSACQLLPICLGGCPAQREDLHSGEACCFSMEYIRALLKQHIAQYSK